MFLHGVGAVATALRSETVRMPRAELFRNDIPCVAAGSFCMFGPLGVSAEPAFCRACVHRVFLHFLGRFILASFSLGLWVSMHPKGLLWMTGGGELYGSGRVEQAFVA